MRLHRHMSAVRWLGGILCLLLVAEAAFNSSLVSAGGRPQSRAASTSGPIYPPRSSASFGKLTLSFEDNRGQAGPKVDVISRGLGATLSFNYSGAAIVLRRAEARGGRLKDALGPSRHKTRPAPAAMSLKLVGADPRARAEKSEPQPGRSNYLVGRDPKRWRTNIPNYGRLSYANVYRGIDITYYGNRRQLEYDFVVRPGGNPSNIAFEFKGSEKVELNADGDLKITLGGGEVLQRKPFAYQEAGGLGRAVSAKYVLKGGGRVGFEVGGYDKSRPLVIDPVLVYSTYLGGGGDDQGLGVAVDSSGKAYITGVTTSTDFPVSAGAAQAIKGGGGGDVFVTKLNAAGTAVVYSTYVGGVGDDEGLAVAVDLAGSAYVTGLTNSPDFPVTQGSLQTTHGGGATDAFVMKLDAAGAGLTYGTYLGGDLDEEGYGLAVDAGGNAYVAGVTDSANFPTHSGFQTTKGQGSDAFVSKLNFGGTALSYSTFAGGGGLDWGFAVSADAAGNAYLAGSTNSNDFPVTAGSLQSTQGGTGDGFVTKVNTNATGTASLAYSTYLGGGGFDLCGGVAVDGAGSAYVTGLTASTNFPTTAGAPQSASGGGGDAFVSKLHANGSALLYSTYLGGGGADWGRGIVVDTSGQAYVTGSTESSNFPVGGGAFQPSAAGKSDAFISKVNAAGTAFVYSSLLGGAGADEGYAVAGDLAGNAFMVGTARSNNLPVTQGVLRTTSAGGSDVFASKVSRQEVGQPPNQIGDAAFFVRQHYRDFLSREADADGLAFWVNQMTNCATPPPADLTVCKVNVSAAFFLSIEFQQTGYLVYRFYKAAYGDIPGAPVPLRREDFLPDAQRLGLNVRVGIGDWEAQLEANKVAFSREFVARARFTNNYPSNMSAADFVAKLNQNTGNALTETEVNALAQQLAAAGNTSNARASTLRQVAENAEVVKREFNRAFVLMQYYGYLRRSPDDTPDTNFDGYNFWLGKLNEFNGNFVRAEMVKAFLSSIEYRGRFGTP